MLQFFCFSLNFFFLARERSCKSLFGNHTHTEKNTFTHAGTKIPQKLSWFFSAVLTIISFEFFFLKNDSKHTHQTSQFYNQINKIQISQKYRFFSNLVTKFFAMHPSFQCLVLFFVNLFHHQPPPLHRYQSKNIWNQNESKNKNKE